MKHFLLKLRNFGAVVCASIVVILLVTNVYLFGKALFGYESGLAFFGTLRTIWWLNFAAVLCAGLGNLLHVAEDSFKADVLGFSGFCAVISFFVIGMLYAVTGYVVGKLLLPSLMLVITMYACVIILLCTNYFVRCIRKTDETEDYYAV